MKKYELTNETIEIDGKTLHRIIALKHFGGVKKGDLGGWVESEKNLSQDGNCWIYNGAMVYGGAEVSGEAVVFRRVKVYGEASVSGEASVFENAVISGNIRISGKARVYC